VLPALLAAGHVELAASAFASNVLSPALAPNASTLDATSLGWAWFATALMDGSLVDLTRGDATIDWSRSGLAATSGQPAARTTAAGVPLVAPAP
jgi:hypothetical protein